MRLCVVAPFVAPLACVGACTLVNSENGLVGPPLASDASLDGASALDGDSSKPVSEADVNSGPPSTDADATASLPDAQAPPEDSAADSAADLGPTAIYTGRTSPLGIAVYNGTICWVEGDTLRLIQCAPTAGGASQVTLVASQTNDALMDYAFDVALDDTYLYWSNGQNNQVVRKTLDGGASAQYFSGDGQVSYIVLDGTNVWATDYVANATSGNIVVGPVGTSSSNIYPSETQAAGVGVYSGSVYWGRASPSRFRPVSYRAMPSSPASRPAHR